MALKSYAVPGLFGEAGRRIAFHYPERPIVPALLALAVAGLEAHEAAPAQVLEYNDVYMIPGGDTMALYDRDGRRIDASGARRGVDLKEFIAARETIEPPRDCQRIDGPLLYLSVYFNHWGHFLTESLSRMWARYAHPELATIPGFFGAFSRGNKTNATTAAFLTSFSSAPLTLVKAFGPTRIEKCFVPQPSFANRAFAFAAHRDALHDVARTFLKDVDVRHDPRPVYLSRSRLAKGNRFITNEAALDEALAARGFRIVHPQEMNLAEQIILFNTHRDFVGCVGSAFHSTLMTLNGEAIATHILSEKFPNVNCLLIDAIVGNDSHYVSTCLKSPEGPGHLTIDVEATLGYLGEAGLLA